MTTTDSLIKDLSQNLPRKAALRTPIFYTVSLLAILAVYATIMVLIQGVREDILAQLHRPFYLSELALLLAVIISSLMAAVSTLYPDAYQRSDSFSWPFYSAGTFITFLIVQYVAPSNSGLFIPEVDHGIKCTLCIAAVAAIPSFLMFITLRRGATTTPQYSGLFAVLTATAVGCFTLRLAEANDSLAHLLIYHYLPTAIFAWLGLWTGKKFLNW